MNNDKKDIQYKILKSEACGHTIEYKMVKKEYELEKARVDEGLSPREKMKAREARSSKEREPRELSPEQYETGKKIARTKAVTETGEKQRKQTLKDVLHTHKQNAPKAPSKEDLEYPMAASEKDCSCEDKAEKCECEDEGMKKREKFYIQKIQELRKATKIADTPLKDIPRELGSRAKIAAQNTGGQTPRQIGSNIAQGARNVGRNIAQGASNLAARGGQKIAQAIPQTIQNIPAAASNLGQKVAQAVPAGVSNLAGRGGQLLSNAAPMLGRAAGVAGALAPSPIGTSADDQKFVQNQMAVSDRNRENAQYGGKNAGQYVLQNAPEGSQRSFQEKTNAQMNQALGTQPAAPTASAAGTNTPENNRAVLPSNYNQLAQQEANQMAAPSFKDAFAAARSARIGGTGGDVFDFGGKKYHSFTKDDFAQGLGSKYNPAAKQTMAPAESIKSTPATPNIENAPSANPMKGPDQGSTMLRPTQPTLPKNQA